MPHPTWRIQIRWPRRPDSNDPKDFAEAEAHVEAETWPAAVELAAKRLSHDARMAFVREHARVIVRATRAR